MPRERKGIISKVSITEALVSCLQQAGVRSNWKVY